MRLVIFQAFAPTPPVVPGVRQWVSYRKLRSWLQLLDFEIGGGRFGCYRPIVRNAQWSLAERKSVV